MIAACRIYQEIKDRYVSVLALSDAELHAYWESKVTVNYWAVANTIEQQIAAKK